MHRVFMRDKKTIKHSTFNIKHYIVCFAIKKK